MRKTLLLFDVDGTLLLTRGAGMRAMCRVAAKLFGEQFCWDGVQPAGYLDPLIFADAAQRNGLDAKLHHDAFHDHYIRELEAELCAEGTVVDVMPGIHDLLAHLRQRARERGDVALGLLTGNYTRAVPLKLATIDVEVGWFDITAFGDEADSRPGLVAVAMRKYEEREGEPVDPRRVIVIGDTPRDVACAHAHGCTAVAVATGPHTLEELLAQNPRLALPDLSDPKPLLDLIEQVS